MNDLQRLVDGLASRLRRAVAIDDPNFQLIAYSTGIGDRDLVREQVILNKTPSAESVAWAHQLRLVRAQGPRWVANPELKILSRLVIPIRFHDIHLGALWIIAPESQLDAQDVAFAEEAAQEAGLILFRERSLGTTARDRVRALTLDLVGETEEGRLTAASQLVEEELFPHGSSALAVVVRPSTDAEPLGTDEKLLLEDALNRLDVFPRCQYLTLIRSDHALNVVPVPDDGRSDLPEKLYALARKAMSTDELFVGVGTARPLGSLVTSYRQALQALRIAGAVPSLKPIARIDACGVYRFLASATSTEELRESVHPAIGLLETEAPWLLRTLEEFLDNAGNTAAVGRELTLHRSTVYTHIERIEALTGLDLSKGEDRLAAHLSLRISRLLQAP